ncbi:putative bifunctional diguanylate cyclase/phosphodiesterase [Vibrio sp. NTOU-M3]|uniref:putative bifunctional diguanylate cyclase/phosphodiesterase n=1 Tax=Vibrio sp. NTOU-M3 TaxID=3234954 RepID=UPI00349F5B9B
MRKKTGGDNVLSSVRSLLYLGFLIAVLLITYTLITEHVLVRWIYILFPISMLVALFTKQHKLKAFSACFSMVVILVGGYIEPLELDAIEESFIFLPLCYIIIFPGSFWPIMSCFLLVASYWYELPSEDFGEFIEDAIEIVAITVFATTMSFFQQKSYRQAKLYRKSAFTDHLTQIPNRKAFYSDLEEIDTDGDNDYSVIQIGLNEFKNVNDSLGYSNGDSLLILFTRKLQSLLDGRGKLYRLAGDEFIILLESSHDIRVKTDRILASIREQYDGMFDVENTSHTLTFSSGIAVLSDASGNKGLWGKNADIALYKAKTFGSNTVQWYDDELLNETIRQHQIEIELKDAINSNQFVLAYQPKVCVIQNKILGAEALIRWTHPFLGVISPMEFIAIAEKTAQIIPIGRWVIKTACQQAHQWHKEGHDVCISVNVSTVQFLHDDIYQYVKTVISEIQLPPHLLQIEITESTLMQRKTLVAETCQKLRELGVTIAIDDFGVAYSSLNYLKRLPIDVLKIDKSFIDDCVIKKTDRMLVRTIIQMGRNLEKQVVAEGVETHEQLEILRLEGCNEFQGYLFSKPVSAKEFAGFLSKLKQ